GGLAPSASEPAPSQRSSDLPQGARLPRNIESTLTPPLQPTSQNRTFLLCLDSCFPHAQRLRRENRQEAVGNAATVSALRGVAGRGDASSGEAGKIERSVRRYRQRLAAADARPTEVSEVAKSAPAGYVWDHLCRDDIDAARISGQGRVGSGREIAGQRIAGDVDVILGIGSNAVAHFG